MAAPQGNTNATKNKRWSQAIDKALKQYNEGDVKAGHALDRIAYRLVEKAITGDDKAFNDSMKEIGDRIEGKATQAVELSGSMEIRKVERTIIDPTDKDS